jgi:hypothetical protein
MAKDFNYKGINYASFDGKTCRIKGFRAEDSMPHNDVSGKIIIPDVVFDGEGNQYTVTAVDEGGFYSIHGGPLAVALPDTVTSIGKSTFEGCCELLKVHLPKDLREISPYTFHGCKKLEDVEIPETVEIIDTNAFAYIGTKSLKLPQSLKIIGKRAFSYCEHIESVSIPESVIVIGNESFCSCDSLTSAIIGESVLLIGKGAFDRSRNLQNVTSCNPVPPKTYLGDKLFSKETYENGILYVYIPTEK